MNKLWVLTLLLLPLPGCGAAPTSSDPANRTELANKEETENKVEVPKEPASDPVGINLAAATASRSVDLSAYVGKYAHDEVEGVTFVDHPAVRAAVEAVVSDPALRTRFLTPAVQSPIETQGTLVVSSGCERHNCPHSWSVSVDQTNGEGEVCYVRSGRVRRYHRGGVEERNSCPF